MPRLPRSTGKRGSGDARPVGGRATRPAQLRLRLFVAGNAPNSLKARLNLLRTLGQAGIGPEVVEVVDVFDAPEKAAEDRILVTPTLVRVSPAPSARLLGTLDDGVLLRATLGLPERAAGDAS